MFKFQLKLNNYDPTVFWRRAIVLFIVALILVFIGQIVFMLMMNNVSPAVPVDQTTQVIKERQERQKVNFLVNELVNRPNRLNEVLAATTFLVDPSR